MSWTVRPVSDVILGARLAAHPEFQVQGEVADRVLFSNGNWDREILVGVPGHEAINGSLFGLVELIDNNPLVCADVFSVPSAGATLGLIGLGPLIRAGLILEDPVVQLSFESESADLMPGLREMGWDKGVVLSSDPQDLGSVRAAVCMAEIDLMDDYSELDGLFEESYGRSFFVRGVDALEWDAEQVRGLDHAAYSLRVSSFEDRALVTVLVMADANGKCGAAQVVHAMNVMCGFEECLGLQVPG